MTIEIFSFKRFWTYFKYVLVQLGRRHAKPALMIAGSGLILYIAWVAGSLVFDHSWSAPSLTARVVVAFLSAAVLELFYAYLYGFVTDRRKGASYLMVPASTTEKFVSILVNALIVIPVVFICVQLGVDALLCLADPTMEGTMAAGGYDTYVKLLNRISEDEEVAFLTSSLSGFSIMTLLSGAFNYLYFLLCGMCFRKNKIVGAIVIAMGVSFVMSLVFGLFAPQLVTWAESISDIDLDQGRELLTGMITWMNVVTGLLVVGVAGGIFYRLKTLKH